MHLFILRPCTNQYISCSLIRDYNPVPNCILFLLWSSWLAFVLFRCKRLVHALTLWLGQTLSSHSLVPTGRHAPGFCLRVLILLHVGPVMFAGTGSVLLVPAQQSFFFFFFFPGGAACRAVYRRSLWGCDVPRSPICDACSHFSEHDEIGKHLYISRVGSSDYISEGNTAEPYKYKEICIKFVALPPYPAGRWQFENPDQQLGMHSGSATLVHFSPLIMWHAVLVHFIKFWVDRRTQNKWNLHPLLPAEQTMMQRKWRGVAKISIPSSIYMQFGSGVSWSGARHALYCLGNST